MSPHFHGLYVATTTPFTAADTLDLPALRAHVQFLVEGGVDGLSPAGTTGEFLYLSQEERAQVVAATVEAADARVPVMAGIWALRTAEVTELARRAEASGAAALFLPPPIYYPASDDVVYRWYATVREASDLPLFAYNIPSYAANTVSFECFERLLADGVVAGIKDSTGKADRVQGLVERAGERGIVMAASDSFATRGREVGASGFISAIANAYPRGLARLWAGEVSLQPAVDRLRTAVKQAGGIPAIKFLISERGLDGGGSRLPFAEAGANACAALAAAHAEAGSLLA